MAAVPLTRCVFLVPFANILDEIGAPTPSLLAKFHLPTHLHEKPKHYAPLFPALRWVATAEVSQGLTDFGFLAGRRLGFEALNDRFKTTVRHAPTLLAALQSFCRFVRLEDNVLRVRLERDEESLKVCFENTIPGAERMQHLEHAQWIQNLMSVQIVRQFAGSNWEPSTFAFQAHYSPSNKTQSFWPNTRFLSGQNATWIDVPASQLGLPNLSQKSVFGQSLNPLQPIDSDIVTTLKAMLAAYLDGHVPTVAEAAEIVGTSVRSLQRDLSFADLTYSRLIDQVRFEEGAVMLRQTDAKITDVAYAVGSNPAHFARMFRRIAGVTPHEFRKSRGQHQPT